MLAFIITSAVLIFIATALFVFYLYRRFICHTFFKNLGIPGPEPHWLYGNLREIWATENRHLVVHAWTKQYGKFFGYYEGSIPILVTSSTEAIERLCVKQFESFPGRKVSPVQPKAQDYPDSPFANIASVHGSQWKRLRTIVNPGFSTGRLRSYTSVINKSQKELMDLLGEYATSSKSVNIFEQFQYLTLDVISEIAFGIQLNSIRLRGEDNPIIPGFKQLLAVFINESLVILIASCLPEIVPIIERLIVFQMKYVSGVLAPFRALAKVCESVIATRRASPSQHKDLLQMLIDGSNPDHTKMLAKKANHYPPFKPLSDNEIISQSVHFFGAGYGTTSATLAYAAYCLALHPNCQERLYNEVMENFADDTVEIDYDGVMKMSYLDWFIHETIRLFPISIFVVNRFSTENTQICGIPISKGSMLVFVDMWSVHHDLEFWGPVDTEKFFPERFSPDYPTTASRPACAFLGFGYGPRFCIGARLALLEMKMTLLNLVRRFRILEADDSCQYRKLEVKVTRLMMPKNGVWVRLVERDNKNN